MIRISKEDFHLLLHASDSYTLEELSEKTGIPPETLFRKLSEMLAEGSYIHQIIDFKKIGLIPTLLILPDVKTYLYNYSRSIKKSYSLTGRGKVSSFFIPSEYLNSLIKDLRPIRFVKGLEYYFHNPLIGITLGLTKYCEGFLNVDWSATEKVEHLLKYPVIDTYSKIKFDKNDLLLIFYRFMFAFTPLNDIIEKTWKRWRYRVSIDELRNHINYIRNIWEGNCIITVRDIHKVPVRLYYFEGKDSALLARLLTSTPYFYYSLIDAERAVVSGQPTESVVAEIYELIPSFKVRFPFGDIIIEKSLYSFTPTFHRLYKHGKWVPPRKLEEFV